MSTSYNFRERAAVDWKILCFGDDLPHQKKKPVANKREVLDGSYEIERLISKKTVSPEVSLI